MSLFRRRRDTSLPPQVAESLALTKGEVVMADATDATTGAFVVLTTYGVRVVTEDGKVLLSRPWHEVDAGAWVSATNTMQVTWTTGGRGVEWNVGGQAGRFAAVFRERVQGSVVVAEPVMLGERVIGQATVRRDFATGELQPVFVFLRGVKRTDPSVAACAAQALAALSEQVGL